MVPARFCPVKPPPAPAVAAHNQTGFYIGDNFGDEFGGGWVSETVSIVTQAAAIPSFPGRFCIIQI